MRVDARVDPYYDVFDAESNERLSSDGLILAADDVEGWIDVYDSPKVDTITRIYRPIVIRRMEGFEMLGGKVEDVAS